MEETNKKRVLIVDDEPVVRQLVRQILSKDYNVLEAQNGEEAISIARSQKPDAILMDVDAKNGWAHCLLRNQNQPDHQGNPGGYAHGYRL